MVEALRYAMSLPLATTICGIDSLAVLRQHLAIARNFVPMTPREMQAVGDHYAPTAADGRFETYKSSTTFDGAVGRERHEYPTMREMPM